MEAIMSRREPAVDFRRIKMWADKIIRLLNHHNIDLMGLPNKMYVILMHAKSDGRVHATTFERIGDA
jgi:hypothetical protein